MPPFASLKQSIDEILNRTLNRSVRLAITGLSRSGKTVFISSLVHQLMNGLDSTHLPFFEIATSGRLRGTRAQPQPDMHIPAFRYDLSMQSLLSDPPEWPKATNGISEMRLAIRYKPSNSLIQQFSSVNTLYLDIIDYPGEWLLDLPLLELSYETWSRQISAACEKEPRLTLSAPWRAFMATLNTSRPASESEVRQASELYTEFLFACKDKKYGLNLLQPGRFTMPGDMKGAPLLEFCPLLNFSGQPPQNTDSLFHIMQQRYESYKEHVVRKFYREHFSSFDRQIVLIDILRAFNTGHDSFTDMREAINLVMKSFNYGKSGLFNRLFNVKIDKLLFAATKADHVTPNQLPNLERFLQLMIAEANNHAVFEGVETATLALSALQCTQAAHTEFKGQQISCIKGIPKDGNKPIALFPGEVPTEIPSAADWTDDRFQFLEFRPPRLSNAYGSGLPHIRMDRALEFLLGDKFS